MSAELNADPFNGVTFSGPGTGLVFSNGGAFRHVNADWLGVQNLKLLTNVRYSGISTNQALFTSVYRPDRGMPSLYLTTAGTGPATRTFDVAESVGLSAALPEMVMDMCLAESPGQTAALVKTGRGVLQLQRLAGAFTGGITVTGGTLQVTGPYTEEQTQAVTIPAGWVNTMTVASTNGMRRGQPVACAEFAAGTVVVSLDNPTQVSLSNYTWHSPNPWTGSATFAAASASGAGAIAVRVAGALAGDSAAAGHVTIGSGGTLNAGTLVQPVGTFKVLGNLDMSGGGGLVVDISRDGANDLVEVTGTANLAGCRLSVNLPGGYEPPRSTQWTIMRIGGAVTPGIVVPAGYSVTYELDGRVVLSNPPRATVINIR